MKNTIKITIAALAVIISVLSIGLGSFVLALPPNDFAFQSYTGHSLSEDSWDIIYDVVGDQMVTDLSPGPFTDNISEGINDNRPFSDANFYVAYTNFGQIQGLYIANQNITLSTLNTTKYGCAPYQMIINHFYTAGNLEIFTINTFMGLLAYRENSTIRNGIPNAYEEMYLGWTTYSELFKHLFNEGLNRSGIPENNWFDPISRSTGTPIIMTEEITGEEIMYKYGMSYENLFVVWQEVDVQLATLNDTENLNYLNIVERVSAFGVLDSLNYTFEVKGILTQTGASNVTTTTSYEIGEFNHLWIMDDTEAVASYFGGHYYPYITGRPMTLYNESNTITNRLDGNSTTPGFSLAVANYANVFVLGVRPPDRVIRDQQDREFSPNSDKNVSRTDLMLRERRKLIKIFEISFEGKDTYILDGNIGNPKHAINVIVTNTRLRCPMASQMYSIASGFIERVFRTIFKDFGVQQRNRILYNSESLFYLTCFPEWGGKTIVNDPTFTVFGNFGAFLGIPGMQIGLIVIVSVGSAAGIFFLIRKKRR